MMSDNIHKRKVNFIIIGAMKSGTSATSHMLGQHEDISIHIDKEPNYFSVTKNNTSEYHNGFDSKKKIWGEASTDYSKHLDGNLPIAKNIRDYNPKMKIIYIVRNPIERIVSDYIHLHSRGYINCNFSEALSAVPGLMNRSRYASQIAAYEDLFPSESILVLDYIDLKNDYTSFINSIVKFIDAPPQKITTISKNKSVGQQKFLARYDKILHNTPKWMKEIIPQSIKTSVLNKMKGPVHQSKPQPSHAEIQYIASELDLEITTMQNKYNVLRYLDPKTLQRI